MSNYQRPDEERHTLDEIEEMEQEEIRQKQKSEKKKFNLFDRRGDDKDGVSKDEKPIADEPTLKNFFVLTGRKLNQLLSVNLLLIFGNFPIFFILLGMSGYLSLHSSQPMFALYAPLRGALQFGNNAANSALMTIFSRQADVTVFTTADYIMFGIGALVIVTYGLVRVGVTYIVRNMFRGEPVFLMHDFFYSIKRNWKQAVIVGIVDLGVITLIVSDIVFYNLRYSENFFFSTMFFMSIAFAFIWFFMRPYIWLMLVTFDIKIFKIIKNAFIFTIVGIKRNIMVLIGTALLVALDYILLLVYLPLGVILPFVILPALLILMGIYGAYPKLKEIMIDPYYTKTDEEKEET